MGGDVNVGGVISVAVFYALILAIGIWFGFKQKRQQRRIGVASSSGGGKYQQQTETIILAGRNIGLFVGILTMTGIVILVSIDLLIYCFCLHCA